MYSSTTTLHLSKEFVPVDTSIELPADDNKYLFYDSTNVVKSEELLTAKEYSSTRTWMYDTWLKPVTN